MDLNDILLYVFNTGLLALAIMALAIAIIIYPTLRNQSHHKKK